jgi:glycerol dehydrogenase
VYVFCRYRYLPQNAAAVLLDPEVVANSPLRFTVAGFGDALSTFYEVRGVEKIRL